jgi:hypothetical protein
VFSNRHRYYADHTAREALVSTDDDQDGNVDVDDQDGNVDVDDNLEGIVVGNEEVVFNIEHPESAATQAEEARELLVLESAKHVQMARAQRTLYQALVADAVSDAKEGKDHVERRYTFVVDYGQNMEVPVFNDEQPGCSYYYSPLSVYNLGVVNHAHMYEDGDVRKHMYCHVYHEGVGKKGANNVASLILKTLRQLNLLREDVAGGELNIVFDNCSGQNKNNTVLKLAPWLKQMGYFKKVNFVFLVVGHTKNAADSLFNSLKHEYRKKNIFTMQDLFATLNVSESVTVVPTTPEDFLDYGALLDSMYRDIAGMIKQNHIFSCCDDNDAMNAATIQLRECNLDEYPIVNHRALKRSYKFNSLREFREHCIPLLLVMKCLGLNPYKAVEMWKNYRPIIPIEFHDDILYMEPDATIMSKVKDEKLFRAEARKVLKAKKYGDKESAEDIAFGGTS